MRSVDSLTQQQQHFSVVFSVILKTRVRHFIVYVSIFNRLFDAD